LDHCRGAHQRLAYQYGIGSPGACLSRLHSIGYAALGDENAAPGNQAPQTRRQAGVDAESLQIAAIDADDGRIMIEAECPLDLFGAVSFDQAIHTQLRSQMK
jgi:hypothetical protein